MSFVGCLRVPFCRFCIGLLHTLAIYVAYTQIVLSIDVSLLSGFVKPFYCIYIGLIYAKTVFATFCQCILRFGMSLAGSFGVPLYSLVWKP